MQIYNQILTIILIIMIIISPLTIYNIKSQYSDPATVLGYVYMDDVKIKPNEVILIFSKEKIEASISEDWMYEIVFGVEEFVTGTFLVLYQNETYTPDENLTIQEGVYFYNINLNIFSSDENGETPIDENLLPIADAGGPYYGHVNSTIAFDASASTDPDGQINLYEWDLGDGSIKTGITVSHNYSNEGDYQIILTVTDNNDTSDEDITNATITKDPNNPPTQPLFFGNTSGSVNILYNYTVTSSDPNNNTIKYVIEWDDQTKTISEFLKNGTSYKTNHQWTLPGIYTIKTYAEDNKSATSKTTKIKVLIDAYYCQSYGYLIDYTNDKIFDVFHSNYTGNETYTKYNNGPYLINDDDDEDWDFEYNIETDTVFNFGKAGIYPEKKIDENTNIFFILGIFIIILFTIISIIIIGRNKQKTNEKEKLKDKKIKKTSESKKQQTDTVNKEKTDIRDIEKEIDSILKNK